MPFILANAWLASALMEFPISACLIWPVRSDWPASAAGRMTYLSWDEGRTGVLEYAQVSRRRAGTDRARLRDAIGDGEDWMNSTRCFRRAMLALVPVAAISLGFAWVLARYWRSRRRRASPTPAPRHIGVPRPRGYACANGHAGTAARRKQIAGRQPRGRRPAAGRRAGPDRRSLRRGNHAGAEEGRDPQGNGQLGFGVRHPDGFIQDADRPARQAEHCPHQAIR